MTALPGNRPAPISNLPGRLQRTSDWLIRNVLPLGWLVLLTGMFWVGERPHYHKLYYTLLAAPALLAVVLHPRYLRTMFSSPLLVVFALFSVYTLTTLAWSSTDDPFGSLVKRPLYVLLLFVSAGLLALRAPERLMISLRVSAYIAALAALISLGLYLHRGEYAYLRFSGYGALYNPLLTAHVYGVFMAFWVASWIVNRNPFDPPALLSLAVLGALTIATGSRTPLMALVACSAWLMIVTWNKRSLALLVTGILAGGLLLALYPEAITSRGMSARPEIWEKSWQLILDAPWLGHGYDAPLKIWIATLNYTMADPHNMLLAVLYYCGAIGLVLWLLLYGLAFGFAWRNRKDPLVAIISSLLVFGLAASMTEGGSFISRPKEHWFLIWIPMALMFAAEIKKKTEKQPHELVEKV
ncbi:O-antigen ligase family protein [Pseudomonas sp. GCM10022186]|uniref:O-antigen ligase family protein n=1 Tax=Pseudomonas sp. GCM10022186 TaxID=3252650 RepID=UPI0036092B56